MSENEQERRVFTRINIDCRAELSCGGTLWSSKLLDVSLKGALLERPEGFDKATEACTLTLLLDPSGVSITMQGQIAHLESDTLGFSCEHIDLDSIAHLRRLLALNMGDEALLERELVELIA
jgi:hypothetical protein